MSDEPTDPSFRIRSTEGVIATAGQVPIAFMLDLDGDGIPDWQEPWLYVTALRVFSWFALTFAAPHTVFYQLGEKAQTDILPKLGGKT